MGKHVNQTPPSTARFVDPFRDAQALTPITREERTILRTVNQKIAARPSLRAIVDYLFDNTQALIPCDRIGLAFVDERGERVTSYYNRASYAPLAIDKDYSEALQQTSLQRGAEHRAAAHHRQPRAVPRGAPAQPLHASGWCRRACAPTSPAR